MHTINPWMQIKIEVYSQRDTYPRICYSQWAWETLPPLAGEDQWLLVQPNYKEQVRVVMCMHATGQDYMWLWYMDAAGLIPNCRSFLAKETYYISYVMLTMSKVNPNTISFGTPWYHICNVHIWKKIITRHCTSSFMINISQRFTPMRIYYKFYMVLHW